MAHVGVRRGARPAGRGLRARLMGTVLGHWKCAHVVPRRSKMVGRGNGAVTPLCALSE